MKIKFLGVGSAFTTPEYFQSNLLITAPDGRKLLVDCGTDIRFSLGEASGHDYHHVAAEIDAVYISHIHSDHIGGMEWLAIQTYFNPDQPRPRLFMEGRTMRNLWDESLRGGLGCIEGRRMNLTDYFECHALPEDGTFQWGGIRFTLVKMPHILTGYRDFFSFGILMTPPGPDAPTVFFTTDTQFQPGLISRIAPQVTVIFHDCETSPFKSVVHAHYDDLRTLPASVRAKMWLYHYQPYPDVQPEAEGFLGFVCKGQEMTFSAAGDRAFPEPAPRRRSGAES